MSRAEGAKTRWLFPCLLISFCAIYLIYYPPTYGIDDEFNILQLSYSLSHGTIFPDHVGPGAGLPIDGHRVSKFSVFHAALIAPLWKLDWRLGFLLAAFFFAAGAFVVRNWLRRENLDGEWTALYFFLFGALYYTQTLLSAVPAAVAGLFGVSLLLRERPRPTLAGLMLGASVLLHPWMGPFAIVSTAVWLLENQRFDLVARASRLIAGALGPIAMLGVYNFATTGSPFRSVYTLLGHQNFFVGEHFGSYLAFYAASLAIFPLAGWVVFSPRWAKGWTIPATSAAMFALASLVLLSRRPQPFRVGDAERDGVHCGSNPRPAISHSGVDARMNSGRALSRRKIDENAAMGLQLGKAVGVDRIRLQLHADERSPSFLPARARDGASGAVRDDSGQRAGSDFRRRAERDRAGLSCLRTRDADR